MSDVPIAFESHYESSGPNQEILIYDGQIQLRKHGGVRVDGDGKLVFRWLPKPALRFHFTILEELIDFKAVDIGDVLLDVPGISIEGLHAQVLSANIGTSPSKNYIAGIILEDFPHRDGKLTELFFDLPNYHNYFGKPITRDGNILRGRITLEAFGWNINIDSLNNIKERIEAVRSTGGYTITHTGSLRKKDCSPFSFEESIKIRGALTNWIAFTRGLWCSPLFWRSDDWTHYSVPKLSQWRGVHSWFPKIETNKIPSAFTKFVQLLSDETWKIPFGLAVYWYIHANECAGGVEGSLVLIQTALEMLAWTYLIEDKNILTLNSWNNLGGAADRIELLLTELNIPISLSKNACSNLHSWATSVNRQHSGPVALVGIRNAFVHPTTKNLQKALSVPFSAKKEAWQLSLLYLEAIILNLLDYDGSIYSRLRSGLPAQIKVDQPWLPT